MKRFWIAAGIALACAAAQAQEWDRIRGEVADVGDPMPHWFWVVRSFDVGIAHLLDGDTGAVEGTLSLSLLTPELASGVQLTDDGAPLLPIAADDGDALRIHDGRTGRHLRSLPGPGGLGRGL